MTTLVAVILLAVALALIFGAGFRVSAREDETVSRLVPGQVESELLRRPLRSRQG
ncbi:MAG TPA: hypothetical protein VFN48_01795 [Solirubrobacteraceae bacterium]|nr:hypothetical protein [Solirubrobacteraceae bacterium]